jgi:1,4-dihydroxy-2-naphthoyl-CoA hydrolase
VSVNPWDGELLPEPPLAVASSFEGFLDLRWEQLSTDAARVRFAVRDDLRQPLGLLHGGIYSAVAETIASVATARGVWRDGITVSGLSNTAHFLRPVTAGTVHVLARCRHRDRHEWFWSHEFCDDDGRLCALVDVRIAVRSRRSRAGAGAQGPERR